MAEEKNKKVETELRSTFGRLLPEGRKNDEQLNEVDGGYPQSRLVVTTGKLV